MNKKRSIACLVFFLCLASVQAAEDYRALYTNKFDASRVKVSAPNRSYADRAAVLFWTDHLSQASKIDAATGKKRASFLLAKPSLEAMAALVAPLPKMAEQIRAQRKGGAKRGEALASKEKRIELRMRQLVTGLPSTRAEHSVREPFAPLCGEVMGKEAFIEYASLALALVGEPVVMVVDVLGSKNQSHSFALARIRSNQMAYFDAGIGEIGYQTTRPRKFEGAITDATERSLKLMGEKEATEFAMSVFLLPPPEPKGATAGRSSSSSRTQQKKR